MKVQGSSEGEQAKPPWTPLGCLLSFVAASLLFPPMWAGVNVAFGTALDGPIGVFLMEPPCQRLARTTEPLSSYSLGKSGKGRWSSPAVCHFVSGDVYVDRRDGLGFTGREFVYIATGLVGYLVCFVGAFLLTIFLVRAGQRFLEARLGRVQGSEPPSPKRSRRSRSRRRRKR